MKKIDNYFRIKNSIKTLVFSTVLILFVVSSCSDDESEAALVKDGGPFQISELAGNWEATQALFWRSSDGLNVDIVAEGGSLSLTVQSSGRCTFIVDPFDREPYTVSGEMFWSSYEGDEALAIVWDGNPDERSSFTEHVLNNTTFNLGCLSECGEYDFNNNGTSDIADLGFVFIRV